MLTKPGVKRAAGPAHITADKQKMCAEKIFRLSTLEMLLVII